MLIRVSTITEHRNKHTSRINLLYLSQSVSSVQESRAGIAKEIRHVSEICQSANSLFNYCTSSIKGEGKEVDFGFGIKLFYNILKRKKRPFT